MWLKDDVKYHAILIDHLTVSIQCSVLDICFHL